jgi:hypothetical protein
MRNFLYLSIPMVAAAWIAGCETPDPDDPSPDSTTFDITVENVSPVYAYLDSGAAAVPVGADEPGPLFPGDAYEWTFAAAPGHRLSFAAMFVQSNDLFYAPAEGGIALYDGDGMPLEGDITDQLLLWDAGTEINQEPGLGADQAPRQMAPDSGDADPDDTVRLASDEYGNLPATDEVISAGLVALDGGWFRLTVTCVSGADTLMTSDGGAHPVPLAPVVYVIHDDGAPLFTAGGAAGEGLEALAEDGDPSGLAAALAAETGLTTPIAPGVWAVHGGERALFTVGEVDDGMGLEALAEDGDPTGLAASLGDGAGAFDTPEMGNSPAPAFPGEAYAFTAEARDGDHLSVATMLVQSNDWFFALDGDDLALFDADGEPFSGTVMLPVWDAGTEVDEAPGAGPHQAPRQMEPDSGMDEDGPVEAVDGYLDYVLLTVTPR